ncbi:MAG: dipeptidase [Planctomycetota bacterium]|jgi:acetylornithine deacetylase/succinyl-diaminopimelate desuccinylase-like protein
MTTSGAAIPESLNPVLEHVDANLDAARERLFDLLRIPSISTDPAYAGETRRAAEWCCAQLADLGFDASVRDTEGHPMVLAKHAGPDDAPHLLYYGHYDVQPPDPVDLWHSAPFEPIVQDSVHGGKIVARGAVDDKGQLMTIVEAFRAWLAVHGSMPVNVTVLLEGEEESGSPSLDAFLESHRAELDCDVCLISDSDMWNVETPAITYMLRGLLYVQIRLHGPTHDLHSGVYGGAVMNPITALTRVLAQLHDADGVVQIPAFYDDVRELGDAERTQWESLGFDEAAFVGGAGLEVSTGEKGRSALERTWSRPTCELNGIWGGYTGEGAKTVIPAHASAKLSCRLVADQDPKAIYDGIVRFLEERTPTGCRWELTPFGMEPAIRVPTESRFLEAAREGLLAAFGKEPVLMGCGGSIPVVGAFQKKLGFDSILVGFGLDDDRAHSPNEKFELKCFEHGIRAHVAMLERFGAMTR